MKPLLFIDFDGTLCHDRFWRSVDNATKKKIQDFLFVSKNSLVAEWMRGGHSSEEINRILSKKIGVEYEYVWNIFVKDCKTMRISASLLDQIAKLRTSFTIVLSTDNMDCFDRFTVPALGLGAYFDFILNSYNERRLKNDDDGQFFGKAFDKFNAKIDTAILIDNSKRSCGLFEKLGGKSRLVTPKNDLEYWLNSLKQS